MQNLGAASILCTDKTGTLTEDRMEIHSTVSCKGQRDVNPLYYSYLISSSQSGLNSIIDAAIVRTCEDSNLTTLTSEEQKFVVQEVKKIEKLGEIPFDFGRRKMSVVSKDPDGKIRLYTKGAAEEMLKSCSAYILGDINSEPQPLEGKALAEIEEVLLHLRSEGLRVMPVGFRELKAHEGSELKAKDELDLILIGFITLLDPPKRDTKPTLEKLVALNVRVKVLTGDDELVAKKVCQEIGLDTTYLLTGNEMRNLTLDDNDPDLRQLFLRTTIFAKLSPSQKARVVYVLKDMGNTVGFLGDGINDALALREADVGISVDSGSDLAKDVADIILTEKSLAVLHQGIVEGRTTHGNTIKYIKMTASSNFGNVFSVLIASSWLTFLPMLPIHFLINNMMYDISQVAIPWDHMDEEYIREPQPWKIGSLARFMVWIGPTSSIFDMTTFCFCWFYLGYRGQNPEAITHWQSCWFIESLITQTLIVHMIRTEKIPFLQSSASWIVCCTTILCCGLGFIFPEVPGIAQAVSMAPLPWQYFVYLPLTMLTYMLLVTMVKHMFIKVYKQWL